MTSKAAFTNQDWELLQTAPLLTGLAVIVRDSGVLSKAVEKITLINQLKNAQNDYPNNELIQSLVGDNHAEIDEMLEEQSKSITNSDEFVDQMLDANQLAVSCIEQNALPSEVEEYKQFVYLCGEKVARSAGEGLFGTGEKVSQKEVSLLAQIKSSLGLRSLGFLSSFDLNENVSIIDLLKFLFGINRWSNTLNGIFFVTLFSLAAYEIASTPLLKSLTISPLIVGIVLGAIYANTLGQDLPREWIPGVNFCTKKILRLAIIFYGVRVSIQDFLQVGLSGAIASVFIVVTTFLLGMFLGQRVFRLDRDVSILTAAGSAVCGAAAVLAVEDVLKAKSYKSALAVSTVVLFGTAGMFLYPILYRLGVLPFDDWSMGIYIGSTLHEVAHVAAAGQAISEAVSKNAVIVKMIRVIMLVPLLLTLSAIAQRQASLIATQPSQPTTDSESSRGAAKKTKILIPWFAVLFLVVIALNSLLRPSAEVVGFINTVDTFGLTMAMTALGMETNTKKFEGVGMKPIYLGIILWVWLSFGGLAIVNLVS